MKKAQSGKDVAVLVLLIAVFLVLYMLLLPPAEREALLNEGISTEPSTTTAQQEVLLSESPGTLSAIADKGITHEFNPINLFIKTEPITQKLAESLYVSKTLLSENSQKLTLPIEDKSNLKDIVLYFTVKEQKGKLKIKLNENIAFFDEISAGEIKLIPLPVNYIQDNNIIELTVSSPGIAFWRTNSYTLEKIGVKETFELINPREERTFSISESELSNIDRAILSYSLYCNSLNSDSTRLKIFITRNQLFSGIINCGTASSSIEIPVNYLQKGSNKLMFSVEEGDFVISNIKINTDLKEKSYPQYHFNLDSSKYNDVLAEKRSIILTMLFTDSNSKKASILINGNELVLDTKEVSYSKDISKLINAGDNLIKIVPSNTFTINTLRIILR
ncbi:MAG: hypothetical protein AB1571_02810 [Nanoarchaeota archaeon]